MYRLMAETHWMEEVGNYVSYGVQVCKGDEVLCTISDLSLDKNRVADFVERCNREELSVLHIQDVIDDEFFCGEGY